MKRTHALAVVALLVVALTLLFPRTDPLVGRWEATVDPSGGEAAGALLRYTFWSDGTYLCRVSADGAGAAELRGNYQTWGRRLYLSEGPDYKIDLTTYDLYQLEGDTLTLLENARDGDMGGFYPLTLHRVEP